MALTNTFVDESGGLILFANDQMGPTGVAGYWSAALHARRLEINPEPIASPDSMGWREWASYPNHGASIPGLPGSRLTPTRLENLESEITAIVRQRLGLR